MVRLTPWATVVLTRAVVASEDMEDRTVASQTERIEEAVAAAAVVLSMPADPTVNHHHRNNSIGSMHHHRPLRSSSNSKCRRPIR